MRKVEEEEMGAEAEGEKEQNTKNKKYKEE